MKMFFRYMRTDLKRALEGAGFWLSIAAVAVAGLLYLIEELDSYLDVMYVFHQAIYGSMFFLNYIFTAIPCASLLVEDWETGYYRPAMVRGGLISYGIAKAAVIFTIPSAVLAAGNFLFLLILKVRLPWMGSVGSQVAGVVGERVAGALLANGHYLTYAICYCLELGILLGILNLLAACCSMYLKNRLLTWIAPLLFYFLIQYLLILAGISDLGLLCFFDLTYNEQLWGTPVPLFAMGAGLFSFAVLSGFLVWKMERAVRNG